MSHDLKDRILHAEARIRPYIRETILEPAPWVSRHAANVYCKLENLQHTGSFKVRGALNKILTLPPEQRLRGLVSASTGNHGAGVAFASKMVETSSLIFVPEHTPRVKVDAIERLGAEVRRYGDDAVEAEVYARQYAVENNMTFVSPYNDIEVVAGQGTIGVELCRQLDHIDAVFVSVGGGGLISGIAGYLKAVNPDVRIIGCSPVNSQVMIQSVKAGKILELESLPTLSEGTAGGVEAGAITLELCSNLVDDYITVTEEEIAKSLLQFIQNQHMLIEGSAAVSVASYLKMAGEFAGKNVIIVICGANIGLKTLAQVFDNKTSWQEA